MIYKTETSYHEENIHSIGIKIFGIKTKLISCLKFNFGHYPKYNISIYINEKQNIIIPEVSLK